MEKHLTHGEKTYTGNLRDEWDQITDKAETVLIVNTLILGVAFTMLIEGMFRDVVSRKVIPLIV